MQPSIFIANEGCHDTDGGVAGGQIGYRWQSASWVFGLEAQGNWADLRGSNESLFFPGFTEPLQDGRIRPVHRPGRLGLEQHPALREGRRRGDRQQLSDRFRRHERGCRTGPAMTPGGARGRRRPRIRLRAELVGWRRIRPYVHGRPQHHVRRSGHRSFHLLPIGISSDADLVTVRVNYRWGGPVIARY